MEPPISLKANRVLNIIVFAFFLILIRVWYLAVIQREAHVALSLRPQRRTCVERIERASIRDRFNIPMALNKTQYAAAVCYEDIRLIPSVQWVKEEGEKRKKIYPRALYIHQLAQLLAEELTLDPQDIEDIIHAKASLFPHTSFILKEGISEALYYRLKFLETQWTGLRTERKSRRYYPLGKVGSDIIGYLGAINSKEYLRIAREINTLQSYLTARESGEMPMLPKGFDNPLAVRERLKQLQEKAYTLHDLVGKTGIEASFEEELRGYSGKTVYEIDNKGNSLRKLPGSRKAISGQRVVLSISSELQAYAEQLLAQHEQFRESRHPDGTPSLASPWIKGGAIVAMDTRTGEVLTLASYPRFDPNDFAAAGASASMLRWLENEAYVGEIWDGKRPLERERFDERKQQFYDETLDLNWYRYLEAILPEKSALYRAMRQVHNLSTAYLLQKHLEHLLALSEQTSMKVLLATLYNEKRFFPFRNPVAREEVEKATQALRQNPEALLAAKQWLDPYLAPILHQDDQLLALDLCKMIVNTDAFSPELLHAVGHHCLAHYREISQIASQIQSYLRTEVRSCFHKIDFLSWRHSHFKEFLNTKRKEEKEKKQYARPYTEYLEQLEQASFKEFWQRYRLIFLDTFIFGKEASLYTSIPLLEPYLEKVLALRNVKNAPSASAERLKSALLSLSPHLASQYLQSIRPFQELDRPLYGNYRHVRHTQGVQLEKHLAGAFYPLSGFGYGLSQAFRQWTPLGSVFKLVVAYQALLEKYQAGAASFQELNPLTLIDDIQWTATPGSNHQVLGRFLNGQSIQRLYKGGRLPRGHPNIGKIDLMGAIEQSSNIYFSILAVDHIENPWNLIEISRLFGFGERSGIELPGEVAGLLPEDISHNRTGLYSFAIGQHSLVVTPLQTAVMLSAIANKGRVLTPKITQLIAGNEPLYACEDLFEASSYPYEEALHLVGLHFPLFTATQAGNAPPQVWCSSPEVKRSLSFPEILRDPLIEGMHRVINGVKGTARPHAIRFLHRYPQMKKNFQELKSQIIGKTGTAEILYKQTIDAESHAEIHNHIWFGGISLLPSSHLTKTQSMEPELAVAVYLRLSDSGGKEAVPLATEIIKKWQEICEKQGRRAFAEAP